MLVRIPHTVARNEYVVFTRNVRKSTEEKEDKHHKARGRKTKQVCGHWHYRREASKEATNAWHGEKTMHAYKCYQASGFECWSSNTERENVYLCVLQRGMKSCSHGQDMLPIA